MTVLFRCRVKKPLLDKANKVTKQLGTSTPEMVRIFLAQIAQTGKVPLKLDSNLETEDHISGSKEYRAALLESFYDKSKTW
jgi:antitoxin component of RelBE/YafQ-DinJ toxin-antitoxin module